MVECKDMAVARTPAEMSMEIAELFEGVDGHSSHLQRHQKRAEWVGAHLGEILAWLGISADHPWEVKPFIVTDEELFTPLIRHSSMPVMSAREFYAHVST